MNTFNEFRDVVVGWANSGTIVFDLTGDRWDVELAGQTTGKLHLLACTPHPFGKVLTVHEAGSHYWAGRGERNYAGARIRTIVIDHNPSSETPSRLAYRYVELSDSPAPLQVAFRNEHTANMIAKLSGRNQS